MFRGLTAVGVATGVLIAAASVSGPAAPRNGEIVFAGLQGQGQVFSIAADGSGLKQLTHALGGAGAGSWSPDGRVAFIAGQGLGVVLADGSAETVLTVGAFQYRPSWSPDGQWIAYSRSGLWISHQDGSGVRRIGGSIASPVWSPDGASIAGGDGHDLIAYDVATGTRRVVASLSDYVTSLSWSPDGREIAFTTLPIQTGMPDQRRPVTHVAQADGGGDRVLAAGFRAVWSPDGSRLAVMTSIQHGPIEIVRPDGSRLAEVATDAAWDLSWSPDGQQIAYETERELVVVAADGSARRTLLTVQPDGSLSEVAWSPDGRRLLFSSVSELSSSPIPFAGAQLYAVDPTGSTIRPLTSGPGTYTQPSWSADGRKLAFVAVDSASKPAEISVMNADGSGLRPVAAGIEPALSPNGSRIVFVRGGRLTVARENGRELRVLQRGSWPAWSPDGRAIAYFSGSDLWATRPDGTHAHRVLRGPVDLRADAPPTWFSDNEHIYISGESTGATAGSGGIVVRTDGTHAHFVDLSSASQGSPFDRYVGSKPSPDGQMYLAVWYLNGPARLSFIPAAGGPPRTFFTSSSWVTGPFAWQPIASSGRSDR